MDYGKFMLIEFSKLNENDLIAKTARYTEFERRISFFSSWTIFGTNKNEACISVNFKKVYNTVAKSLEYAGSEYNPSSYNQKAGTTKEKNTAESVAAHSFVMERLTKMVLEILYKDDIENGRKLKDTGHTLDEVTEAASRHDLPENLISDIADNGSFNRDEIAEAEQKYWENYSKYSLRSPEYERNVNQLLDEMNAKSTVLGQILYLSDKVSRLISTLTSDFLSRKEDIQRDHFSDVKSPRMWEKDESLSIRDRKEMELCDSNENGYYKASEMWTVDFLHIRRISRYDHTGYFTAILIMATLAVNAMWYKWRENDYIEKIPMYQID